MTLRAGRLGFTLIELLVTLTLMAVVAGIVSISAAALTPPPEAEVPRRIATARAQAVRLGVAVTVAFGAHPPVTFYPDGSATPARIWDGTATWIIDPWTGEVSRE